MPVNYQMVLTSEQSTIEELLHPKDSFTRKAPHPEKNGNVKENNVTYTCNSSQINKYINLGNKTDMLKSKDLKPVSMDINCISSHNSG